MCVSVLGMNETQQRHLWAAALQILAEGIKAGLMPVPTSVDVWNQFVTPVELGKIADHAAADPLEIRVLSRFAQVIAPAGQAFDLPIKWTFQAQLPNDEAAREADIKRYNFHNRNCLPAAGTAPDHA